MRSFLLLLLSVISFGAFAQQDWDYTTDPAILAQKITAHCRTEEEKVKAIFEWITQNISYRTPRDRILNKTLLDDPLPMLPLDERVSRSVLKDHKAVCDGYARLFKTLCQDVSIEAVVITGYARADNTKSSSSFRSNHTWNAVRINGDWKLLDPTWASGYVAKSTGLYIQEYDAQYYLASPQEFIYHHFPDDLRWTLLENAPMISEFKWAAFRQRSFTKYGIRDYYPTKGIVEASIGDTLEFTINTTVSRNANIAPDSLWEAVDPGMFRNALFAKPWKSSKDGLVTYRIPVTNSSQGWIYLLYNDDAVLRYGLKIH